MPSYPSDVWNDDIGAWKYLKDRGYTESKFMISPPKDHVETPEDAHAINYLIGEWDWGWKGDA